MGVSVLGVMKVLMCMVDVMHVEGWRRALFLCVFAGWRWS